MPRARRWQGILAAVALCGPLLVFGLDRAGLLGGIDGLTASIVLSLVGAGLLAGAVGGPAKRRLLAVLAGLVWGALQLLLVAGCVASAQL